jgi:hypothetical protein
MSLQVLSQPIDMCPISAHDGFLLIATAVVIKRKRDRQLDAARVGSPSASQDREPSNGKIEDKPFVALPEAMYLQDARSPVSRRFCFTGFEQVSQSLDPRAVGKDDLVSAMALVVA